MLNECILGKQQDRTPIDRKRLALKKMKGKKEVEQRRKLDLEVGMGVLIKTKRTKCWTVGCLIFKWRGLFLGPESHLIITARGINSTLHVQFFCVKNRRDRDEREKSKWANLDHKQNFDLQQRGGVAGLSCVLPDIPTLFSVGDHFSSVSNHWCCSRVTVTVLQRLYFDNLKHFPRPEFTRRYCPLALA